MIGSNNYIDPCMFQHGPDPSDLMDKGGVTSTSRMPQQGEQENARVGCSRTDRSVGDLSKLEFRAHFHISDTIPIQLSNDKALLLVDLLNNMIYFNKE